MINFSFPRFDKPNLLLKKASGTLTFQLDTTPILDLASSFDRKLSDSIANAWDVNCNQKVGCGQSRTIDKLVIFGDSLSDQGTFFKITQDALGIGIPPAPYFEGRLSNGPIWVDYFADRFNLDQQSVFNFAVNGAKTGRENVSNAVFGLPPELKFQGVLDELDTFASQPTLVSDVSSSNTLYVLWAGSNDLLNLPRDPRGALKGIFDTVFNIARSVSGLAQLGAEQILIPNSIDLGLAPFPRRTGAAQQATAASIVFNRLLDNTLPLLERGLGVDIIEVDLFKLSQQVAANPGNFGFTNITDPLFEQPGAKNPVGENYVWWDQIHPTTEFHKLIAKTFEAAVEQSYDRSSTWVKSDRFPNNTKSVLEQPLLASSPSFLKDTVLKV